MSNKAMLDHVVGEFDRYDRHWDDRMEIARDIYDLWRVKKPMRSLPWQNQVAVPLMVEAEQTISSRLFTALFPNDAPVDVRAEGESDPKKGIRIKSMLEHYFRLAHVQKHTIPCIRQSTLFGTGYLDAGTWFTKKQWVHTKAEDGVDVVRERKIVESRPSCQFVDFFEMFPHPEKLDPGDGLPIIRRYYRDAEFIKSLEDNGFFDTESLKEALETNVPHVGGTHGSGEQKKRDRYEILEYWGPFDVAYEKGGKELIDKAVPHWIMVVNRKVVIRGIPNPFNHQRSPYLRIKFMDDAIPSWFGVGIGQIGKPSVERIQKIVNQRLDNVDLVINKERVYNGNDPLINTKKLRVSAPGNLYRASDVNNIKDLMTHDVTQSSYREEEIAKTDFRESTGSTAYLQPTEGPKHRTAMGIEMLQGAAGMRFRPVLRKMEDELVQEMAQLFFSNLQQFLDEGRWVQVTGELQENEEDQIFIKPEDIQGRVLFMPTGISETLSKETQVNQLLRFKELTMNDPTINRREINNRIAELFGFKDIHKLTIQEQPINLNSSLSPEEQMMATQRMGEGADPRQIQAEMLKNIPQGGGPPA